MASEDDVHIVVVMAAKVSEITELTQIIVLNLCQEEIMKAQAVTKSIKGTDAGSHKLQRKMF